MSKSDTLIALAERCEAATGPDRELDAAIWWFAGSNGECDDETLKKNLNADPANGLDIWIGCRWRTDGTFPAHYSTSLDDAMTLVPEGWATFFAAEDRHSHSWRWELRGGYGVKAAARAATAGRAFTAAALRAIAAQVQS